MTPRQIVLVQDSFEALKVDSEARITDRTGRIFAHGTSTCLIVPLT